MENENSTASPLNQPETKPIPHAEILCNGKRIPNPEFFSWQRQDKLIFHGIMSPLSDKVITFVSSSKTSVEAWGRLAKSYANASSSRIMGLIHQLVAVTRGTQSMSDYLGTVLGLANELALIGSPVRNNYLILHVLNGVDTEYKELTMAVRAQDSVISFEELRDKLVEYE